MPTFEYTVNNEPQTTTGHALTPAQIMITAGIDPATNYLIGIVGATQKSYKDKPEEQIRMHENMKFITNFTGEVPVS